MGKKIVIVGGVAGGASCATRLRRLGEDNEILLLERGPYISFANCGLPYHIGGTIADRGKLILQTPEALEKRFRIQVRVQHEVLSINREARTVEVRDLRTGKTSGEAYDVLVLSPGADPIRPPLPGIDLPGVLTLRNIPDMDAIIRRIEETDATRAVVIGGGFIGLEMVENLRERGLAVDLVEKLSQVMPPMDPEMAAYLHKVLLDHGVKLHLADGLSGFAREGENLVVALESGTRLGCDLAILSIGVRPEVRLAREAGLEIGASGGIRVNPQMQTSDPRIYAVGDAVETLDLVSGSPMVCALAGPANRQGRLAADHIMGRSVAYRGSQATAVCKLFEKTVAGTGLSARRCTALGIPHLSVHVQGGHHVGYYPGAEPLVLKLVFSPGDGRILGAQVFGSEGVDKRIDVLAVAIRAGMTVYDLEHLELAYAPPYGAAKDPVNMAGFAASNILRGDSPVAYWEEAENLDPDRQAVLDVRTGKEREEFAFPGSLHIPLDEIRNRLMELPKNKELLVHCGVGIRSYNAVRTLRQRGFNARNLSGGMSHYRIYPFRGDRNGKHRS